MYALSGETPILGPEINLRISQFSVVLFCPKFLDVLRERHTLNKDRMELIFGEIPILGFPFFLYLYFLQLYFCCC